LGLALIHTRLKNNLVAVRRSEPNIIWMKLVSIAVGAALWALLAGSAAAQLFISPGGSRLNPPLPPPPPPPPRIEVPAIPQMDVATQPSLRPSPRTSFGDRFSRCLDEGAAGGLNQAGRAAYSRACANQDY
jgi:hypothetical protein